jgi:hypothetical protein
MKRAARFQSLVSHSEDVIAVLYVSAAILALIFLTRVIDLPLDISALTKGVTLLGAETHPAG